MSFYMHGLSLKTFCENTAQIFIFRKELKQIAEEKIIVQSVITYFTTLPMHPFIVLQMAFVLLLCSTETPQKE